MMQIDAIAASLATLLLHGDTGFGVFEHTRDTSARVSLTPTIRGDCEP